MRTTLLTQTVVFMPPVNDIKGSLESNLKIAQSGEKVIVLDKQGQAVLLSYKGLSKWVHESCAF